MRIISINSHYQDKLGYQDYYLGKALKELGHEVQFLTSDVHFDYPDYDNTVKHIIGNKYVGTGLFTNDYGVKVFRLESYKQKYTGLIWLKGFKKKLLELKPDLVISHNIFTFQSIRILFFAKKLNCPIIFDDHTTINLIRQDFKSKIIYWFFRKLFSKFFLKYSDKLIGISETCIGVMNKYFGLSGDKVVMIPLGTDTNIFKQDNNLRIKGREELGIGNETIVITYTGKIYQEKKVHLIIEALNEISVANKKRILIYIIGDIANSYKNIIDEAISKSKYKVVLENAKPIEQLAKVYNLSDICVWPDHLTNSTVDASACGCPIICSNYMTERVIYNNGFAIIPGSLEDLENKLKTLIEDENLRKVMGINSIKLVDDLYSWKSIAQKFIQL